MPTVVASGGRQAATATGDLLFARAFAELVRNQRPDEISVLSSASRALAEGELRQRADAWDAAVPVERYLHRCELKTARLFEAACRLGALEADADADALGAFGRRIGLAFQLLDDVLDVSGPAERTGKHRGTDLLDGTITLPFIIARERDRQLAAARSAHGPRRRPRRAGVRPDPGHGRAGGGATAGAGHGRRGHRRAAGRRTRRPARGPRARGQRRRRALRIARGGGVARGARRGHCLAACAPA